MRKNRVTAAIEENTAAREALTEQLRPIDYSGHVPDEDSRESRDEIPRRLGISERREDVTSLRDDLVSSAMAALVAFTRLQVRLEVATERIAELEARIDADRERERM